jgi:hypothetical protein
MAIVFLSLVSLNPIRFFFAAVSTFIRSSQDHHRVCTSSLPFSTSTSHHCVPSDWPRERRFLHLCFSSLRPLWLTSLKTLFTPTPCPLEVQAVCPSLFVFPHRFFFQSAILSASSVLTLWPFSTARSSL